MVTKLEMGLALNGLAMRMCDDCLEKTKGKMNELEKGIIELFDRIEELERGEDDGR